MCLPRNIRKLSVTYGGAIDKINGTHKIKPHAKSIRTQILRIHKNIVLNVNHTDFFKYDKTRFTKDTAETRPCIIGSKPASIKNS